MRYLVAFGCSHTNGSMLDGVNAASEWNVRNGFPGMLAKKYDRELINISIPGGSNQYIFRSVLQYLHRYMDEHDEHLFLINWTGITRFELRYPNQMDQHLYHSKGDFKDEKSIPFSMGIKASLFTWKPAAELLRFGPYLFDEKHLCNKWASYAYNLQQILAAYNKPYLMTNTCDGMWRTDYNAPIIDKLCTKHYPHVEDTKECLVSWLLDQGIEKTPCWHFREDGHTLWANKLDGYLQELGYDN